MRIRGALLVAVLSACGSGETVPVTTAPVRYFEVALTPAGGDLGAAAADYVVSHDRELDLGLGSEDDYRVVSVSAEKDGLRHVRLQQLHAGVPVRGAEIAVHADDTTFLGFNGYVTGNLDGFGVTPSIDQASALAAARADRTAGADIAFAVERADLFIVPREEQGGADLAWRVELTNDSQADLAVGRWIYLVDAGSGAILRKHDALATEQASGPGGNARRSRTWSSELDAAPKDGQFEMKTERFVTYDLAGGTEEPPDPVKGPLDPIADAAIDDAHGFAEVTVDMMRDWYGHDSIDDNGFAIKSRVHYDEGFENAFWDGSEMTYGDGAEWFYPLSGALDVVAHEINHGFTELHSNLEYAGMSGALNESFSDIAGTLAEFYREGEAADLDLGEDAFKQSDGAIRYLCDPPRDREERHQRHPDEPDTGSIDNASQFTPDMNVHLSSGVPNKAFCLSIARFKATSTGSSTVEAAKKVGGAWYLANASYWTAAATYLDGCQGVVDAARALGYSAEEVAALKESWADVGVECDGQPPVCDDDGACELDAGETCASCAGDCGACSQECSWFDKLKCKIGIGDCSRCDLPSGCGDGLCTADEDDESCGQDCGCAADAGTCGSVAPYGCWCDDLCDDAGDCCADHGDVCE